MAGRGIALLIGTIVIIGMLFSTVLVLSHEGEETGDSLPTEDKSVTSTAVTDSIYAVINENYQSVRHIFEKSCFDCHSSFTSYPWYYEIPGIKGMIDDDVDEALGHFDLTKDFPFVSEHSQLDLLKDIKEEISNGDMPLLSYRMMHWGTLIEDEKQDSVFEWIDSSITLLKSIE
ncbi:MAG TPA: heme-binding domain-containing protein [candidate division Zixibacteria bacterium]|nr:heme-binding domain-containing protein [candidate division Zixibacteria bacterium]